MIGSSSITLPQSVTSIGSHAFSGCAILTNIKLPNKVTSIEAHAFSSCTGLTGVTLSENVTAIGDSAFYDCTRLTSLTLPKNVTSIGVNAFSKCKAMKTLKCQSSTPPVVEGTYFDDNTIANVTLHVPKDAEEAYSQAPGWKEFKTISAF